jgi:hypothetical protein
MAPMNPWRNFHNDFNALKEAEDGIARERVPVAHCYAYVTYSESGEVGCWVEDVPSESLGARFALAASGAGLALGCPQGTPPIDYLLSRLVLDLRENGSEHLMDLGAACFIHRVYEALATYFLRLELKALENTNPSAESESSAPSVPPEHPEFASAAGRVEAISAYTQRWGCSEAGLARRAVVDPANLSRWKTMGLPEISDKKRRIESALANNEPPIPALKKSTDL